MSWRITAKAGSSGVVRSNCFPGTFQLIVFQPVLESAEAVPPDSGFLTREC